MDYLSRLVDLEQPQVGPARDVEEYARAPSIEASRRGDVIASFAAVVARLSPEAEPTPMMAVPALLMIILTSAKSVLIRPGVVISSVIP